MRRISAGFLLIVYFFLFSGCSSIERMQCAMERMADNTSVIASVMPTMGWGTARMAYNSDVMIQKIDRMIADLERKGKTVERSVENYAQTFVDSDRAVISNLKGIREELKQLRPIPVPPSGPPPTKPEADAALQARFRDLEARLNALARKIEEVGK
ncbi:MAG: hypothetical protein LDL33_13370 [Desulfomonile sp.]|nr:hypothetical protein [Desulfomonile sp.]